MVFAGSWMAVQCSATVCLVCECLWVVQVQGPAAWALLLCGASWLHDSPVVPLAFF